MYGIGYFFVLKIRWGGREGALSLEQLVIIGADCIERSKEIKKMYQNLMDNERMTAEERKKLDDIWGDNTLLYHVVYRNGREYYSDEWRQVCTFNKAKAEGEFYSLLRHYCNDEYDTVLFGYSKDSCAIIEDNLRQKDISEATIEDIVCSDADYVITSEDYRIRCGVEMLFNGSDYYYEIRNNSRKVEYDFELEQAEELYSSEIEGANENDEIELIRVHINNIDSNAERPKVNDIFYSEYEVIKSNKGSV